MFVSQMHIWEDLDTNLGLRTKVKIGNRFGIHSHTEGYVDVINQGEVLRK